MKKTLKIVTILIASTILLILITVSILYFNISHKWEKFYTEEEMQKIAIEINNSQPLCKKYFDIYDIIFSKKRKSTMNGMFVNFGKDLLFGEKSTYPSPCVDIYRVLDFQKKIERIDFNNGVRKPGLIFGFGISRFTTPQKCFDYMHNTPEVNELAMSLFKKECKELDNSQMLELVLKFEYPRFRNNQDAFKRKYNVYIEEVSLPGSQSF